MRIQLQNFLVHINGKLYSVLQVLSSNLRAGCCWWCSAADDSSLELWGNSPQTHQHSERADHRVAQWGNPRSAPRDTDAATFVLGDGSSPNQNKLWVISRQTPNSRSLHSYVIIVPIASTGSSLRGLELHDNNIFMFFRVRVVLLGGGRITAWHDKGFHRRREGAS